MKGHAMHNVIITKSTREIMFNYRKLRKLRFPYEGNFSYYILFQELCLFLIVFMLDPDSPFFINGSGKPLSRIQNSSGSLLNKIGRVVGIPDLSPTMIRQAAEQYIQTNEAMQEKSDILNMHSKEVGRVIYAKFPTIRSEWVHSMQYIEDGHNGPSQGDPDKQKEKEMNDLEEADEQAKMIYAQNFALEDRIERTSNRRFNPRCNLPSNDRNKLMKLVYKEVFGGVYQTFPGNYIYITCSILKFYF